MIEELRFEEKSVMQDFDREDAAGMKQVQKESRTAESDLAHYDKRASDLSDAIQREKDRFTGLIGQAANLDRYAIIDERLTLRPQMERTAREHIKKAEPDGRIGFWCFEQSVREADMLLDETGMAERHQRERRRLERENIQEVQHRQKPREQER